MATVPKFGVLSGRIGDLVFYVKNGKSYVRKYTKPTDPKTWKQRMHRARFSRVHQFLYPFKSVIKIGYVSPPAGLTPHNEAARYLYNFALINITTPDDHDPVFTINYSKMQLSRGNIEPPKINSCERIANEILLSWDNELNSDYNHHYDSLSLVAFISPAQVFFKSHVADRSDGHGLIELPPEFNKPLHLWVFYFNQQTQKQSRDMVSNSVYLGEV